MVRNLIIEGSERTHRGTKTTVHFENGESVEVGRVFGLGQISIGDNLVLSRRFDTIPIT